MNRKSCLTGVFLLLTSATAGAEAIQINRGDAACGLIDTHLTEMRRHEYAGLIAHEFGDGLHRTDVTLYDYLGSGNWSAVYGDIPTAETAYFFFETHGSSHRYRDVWSGIALPSDRDAILRWAEDLGVPDDLAQCFVDRVIIEDQPDTGLGFGLTLSFSDKASETLLSRNEEVIVAAYYYADPTPEGAAFADDVGRINLGTQELRLPVADGPVDVTGDGIRTEMLQWVADGSIGVNVNVFSARLSSPDNLLSCDIIDGSIADAQAAEPVALHCSLISEDADSVVKP